MKRRTFLLKLALVFTGLFFISYTALSNDKGSGPEPRAKYVFLFIGDGMGQAQVSLTQAYLAALEDRIGFEALSFTQFPVSGQSTTYANNRLITGSAAAGTALATGHKTNINRISMDPEGKEAYQSVAEKAKARGYKVGIVTSVSIDHATPAVFYAHQPDRNMYFEIGLDLARSGFDYFAGGGFLKPEGTFEGQTVNLTALAADYGYRLVNTPDAFNSLMPGDGKTLVFSPRVAGGASLPFAIDMGPADLTLADFTAKGITLLSGEEGFFMMVEGGKIDWLCHSNDAGATVHEVIAFDKAVEQALAFYHKHPDETLIIVTADHETGGLSLGQTVTKYDIDFGLLKYQKSSVEQLNKIVQQFRVSKSGDDKADFERMLKALESDLGLHSSKYGTLLDEKDLAELERLFRETISGMPAGEGEYEEDEPFMDAAIRMMNHKAGLAWGTRSHTGITVPVYAIGTGADLFSGCIDNTYIPKIIGKLMTID
jgi:alkaline phosphatase